MIPHYLTMMMANIQKDNGHVPSMNEHPEVMDELNDDISIVSMPDFPNGFGSDDDPDVGIVLNADTEFLGVIWRIDQCWYGIMRDCFLGSFPTWKRAANAVDIARFWSIIN